AADRNGMPLRPFTPGFARGRWLQQACLPLTHTKKSSDPARNFFSERIRPLRHTWNFISTKALSSEIPCLT
ncbi:hypothetical protein, partial [Burkholderia gladioli]|uniref:hypothetical protein n=1 Tax=Burkholderia gladioli TaxID=28095 RepID=UPI001ABBBA33